MNVGIIGLGLIGGSMALDLKRRGFADRITGVENVPVNADAALRLGLCDEICTLADCISQSDIIILAVPVGTAMKLLPQALDLLGEDSGKIVLDVCSVKEAVVRVVNCHRARSRYVATHPMAGTEYSGPWAARPGLFDGQACILCDTEESAPDALRGVRELYDALNMRTLFMGSSAHDVHAAYISHISHITSFALALTVLDKEKDEKHIFDLASGGFSSTVRLAKSSADMWVPILEQNRDNVLHVMDTYMEKMNSLRAAVAEGNGKEIRSLIEEANKVKRTIK